MGDLLAVVVPVRIQIAGEREEDRQLDRVNNHSYQPVCPVMRIACAYRLRSDMTEDNGEHGEGARNVHPAESAARRSCRRTPVESSARHRAGNGSCGHDRRPILHIQCTPSYSFRIVQLNQAPA